MTGPPFRGAFPHQHHDPRTLAERIEAQLRERIDEAVDMAALSIMVDVRREHGRPAPDTSSDADRKEFGEIAVGLLAHLREASHADLAPEERRRLEAAEAGQEPGRPRLLAAQVFLARSLPDYWQRFEAHRAAYAAGRLRAPAARGGWLGRLLR